MMKSLELWEYYSSRRLVKSLLAGERLSFSDGWQLERKGYVRKHPRRGWILTVKGCKLLRNPQ